MFPWTIIASFFLPFFLHYFSALNVCVGGVIWLCLSLTLYHFLLILIAPITIEVVVVVAAAKIWDSFCHHCYHCCCCFFCYSHQCSVFVCASFHLYKSSQCCQFKLLALSIKIAQFHSNHCSKPTVRKWITCR